MLAKLPNSSFSGDHQTHWDSTSLSYLKSCPRKYQYFMLEQLRPRGTSIHLTFGILYHAALETYDRLRADGADHDSAQAAVILDLLRKTWEEGEPWETHHAKKTRFTLVRSVVWYLEEFRKDTARTIILANGKPAVELSFKFEYNDIFLCGHLDRVVEFNGFNYVMDRKTTTSTPGQFYFDQYSPDPQMTLYSIAGQIILNSPVRGVIIDVAQIATGFTRFQRGMIYRTPAQLQEWLADFTHWRDLAWRYADAGYWPMNDKACHNFTDGCPYRKLCSRDPGVRQELVETEFERAAWNPAEPR